MNRAGVVVDAGLPDHSPTAVDRLAELVGLAVVPGGLLDQMDQDPAQTAVLTAPIGGDRGVGLQQQGGPLVVQELGERGPPVAVESGSCRCMGISLSSRAYGRHQGNGQRRSAK